MRSLDTNIVVRVIVRDDAHQTAIADRLVSEPAFLAITVVLESIWVLDKLLKRSREATVADMRDIFELPNLTIQNRTAASWALDRFADGADFADMLHIALSATADSFATLDRRIERHAQDAPVPIEVFA